MGVKKAVKKESKPKKEKVVSEEITIDTTTIKKRKRSESDKGNCRF